MMIKELSDYSAGQLHVVAFLSCYVYHHLLDKNMTFMKYLWLKLFVSVLSSFNFILSVHGNLLNFDKFPKQN